MFTGDVTVGGVASLSFDSLSLQGFDNGVSNFPTAAFPILVLRRRRARVLAAEPEDRGAHPAHLALRDVDGLGLRAFPSSTTTRTGRTRGTKHPWALGRSAREVWKEIWPDIGGRHPRWPGADSNRRQRIKGSARRSESGLAPETGASWRHTTGETHLWDRLV